MQLKFFTFSVLDNTNEEETLNKFLRSVKVLEIKRDIVTESGCNYWCICILYLPNQNNNDSIISTSKTKVDYRDLLSESDFKKFCELRKLRKQIADSDAVPAFAVFTDYELSEIAKLDMVSEAALMKVNGIGNKKIEKYGKKFCQLINETKEDEEKREHIQ